MVQTLIQTHHWGMFLDWHPPHPRSSYSFLKATSADEIDCAICSIARSRGRSIRTLSSSTKPSVYNFRSWCSSGPVSCNGDRNENQWIIQDADKEIGEIYNPENESTATSNNDNNDKSSIILDVEKEGIEKIYYTESEESYDDDYMDDEGSGIVIQVEKIAKNRRRIRSRVSVQASLDTVWNILTDYEGLADFIPSLVVSQLLEKGENFARLLQIGQQNLAFGLKFKAKGIIDCYEKDIQAFPFGQRRDIEFKMIEGDFKHFEGKWSVEQRSIRKHNQSDTIEGQGFCTTLFYVVEVEPKLWLPVHLVQGELCGGIKMNLSCIQNVAERASRNLGSN